MGGLMQGQTVGQLNVQRSRRHFSAELLNIASHWLLSLVGQVLAENHLYSNAHRKAESLKC